jgi:hypothetical protein
MPGYALKADRDAFEAEMDATLWQCGAVRISSLRAQAKQSRRRCRSLDCFVAPVGILAMTRGMCPETIR